MTTLRPLQSEMNSNVPQPQQAKPNLKKAAKPATDIRPEPVRQTDESDEEIMVSVKDML